MNSPRAWPVAQARKHLKLCCPVCRQARFPGADSTQCGGARPCSAPGPRGGQAHGSGASGSRAGGTHACAGALYRARRSADERANTAPLVTNHASSYDVLGPPRSDRERMIVKKRGKAVVAPLGALAAIVLYSGVGYTTGAVPFPVHRG
jgi:hypothetical protein